MALSPPRTTDQALQSPIVDLEAAATAIEVPISMRALA